MVVIGECEKASDVPEHRETIVNSAQLEAVSDRTRGLGGTQAVPVTSVGGEWWVAWKFAHDALFAFHCVSFHRHCMDTAWALDGH